LDSWKIGDRMGAIIKTDRTIQFFGFGEYIGPSSPNRGSGILCLLGIKFCFHVPAIYLDLGGIIFVGEVYIDREEEIEFNLDIARINKTKIINNTIDNFRNKKYENTI